MIAYSFCRLKLTLPLDGKVITLNIVRILDVETKIGEAKILHKIPMIYWVCQILTD